MQIAPGILHCIFRQNDVKNRSLGPPDHDNVVYRAYLSPLATGYSADLLVAFSQP